VYPASHAQSASSSLPAGELSCDGHGVQVHAPDVGAYVPAAHGTHAHPSANPAVYPAGQGPRHRGTDGRMPPFFPKR